MAFDENAVRQAISGQLLGGMIPSLSQNELYYVQEAILAAIRAYDQSRDTED